MPSTLTIQPVSKAGSTITFSWNAISSRNYQVQYKTNLQQTAWLNLGSPIAASGASVIGSDNLGPDQNRFYRVELLLAGPASTATIPVTAPSVATAKAPKLEAHYFHPRN